MFGTQPKPKRPLLLQVVSLSGRRSLRRQFVSICIVQPLVCVMMFKILVAHKLINTRGSPVGLLLVPQHAVPVFKNNEEIHSPSF
jgi:hypothetical protein